MSGSVIVRRRYTSPPICEKEILRYGGCPADEADEELLALLRDCVAEAEPRLTYQVCYRELPVSVSDGKCDFGVFRVASADLCRYLADCDGVILFAATVGLELDRLIARYGRIAPARALLMQAFGAERIEALCDAFCAELAQEKEQKGKRVLPRYSPGYGDFPLEAQRQIFSVLDCARQIGLSLNESLLMSPTKSVTAVVGIKREPSLIR